jgi:hypothetical protein
VFFVTRPSIAFALKAQKRLFLAQRAEFKLKFWPNPNRKFLIQKFFDRPNSSIFIFMKTFADQTCLKLFSASNGIFGFLGLYLVLGKKRKRRVLLQKYPFL